MKIAVAGTGYVGLVTGVALAHIGHNVTCVDVDEKKINLMRQGISPIYEKDLENLMEINKERLNYTTNYKEAYQEADVIFIGVGTPEREDGSANLDYLYMVLDQIADSIEKDVVIVIKSTVPIGTNDEVEIYINNKIKPGIKVMIVSNPEFLAQGTAVHDTLYATRIVIGVEDEKAKKIMTTLYEPLTKEPYNVPLLVMDRKSAEMVKYASNDFLALKISYMNELANFAEKIGADISLVANGMSYDPRIGNKFLNSGIGYGGSCFPKDTKALYFSSKLYNSEIKTIGACIEVNENQKIILFKKLKEKFKNLENFQIAILGLTFKPGTDDVREAPALVNAKLLLKEKVIIKAYDPIGVSNFNHTLFNDVSMTNYKEQISYYNTIEDTIKDCQAVLIMTEWPEIKEFDLKKYESLMAKPYIFDGRNCYDLKNISKYAIYYNSIGRKVIDNCKEKISL